MNLSLFTVIATTSVLVSQYGAEATECGHPDGCGGLT